METAAPIPNAEAQIALSPWQIFWRRLKRRRIAMIGGAILIFLYLVALFAGFAIYLPELFPLRLRSTGTSFCYNVGRFVAASGPFTLGVLQLRLAPPSAPPEVKMAAFRSACCWVSLIYLLALFALPFLPETKDRPMPED